jgi:hypothetical protein
MPFRQKIERLYGWVQEVESAEPNSQSQSGPFFSDADELTVEYSK